MKTKWVKKTVRFRFFSWILVQDHSKDRSGDQKIQTEDLDAI